MDVKCPHCGTEYDIEQHEFGKYVECQICRKGFVAGTSGNRRHDVAESARSGNEEYDVHVLERKALMPSHQSGVSAGAVYCKENSPLRQINIYGYREWFIGTKNPVTVFFDGGVREVPYRGKITIESRVNEHLSFMWIDQQGVSKETEVIVGDVKNVVLSLSRKDWSIHASKTNNADKLLRSNERANARFCVSVVIIACAFIILGLWCTNMKWSWVEKIGDWFDETPVDMLGRAHEPHELRNRSPVAKSIDEAYTRQFGLDLTSYWYTKCPRCGTKLTPPAKDTKKVRCVNCGHQWKCR